MASGTIYRRTTPAGAASWVVHTTWNEGGRRRQSKRSFRTKQEAKDELTRFLGAHQIGAFVAPSRMTLRRVRRPVARRPGEPGPSSVDARRLPPRSRPYVLPRLGSMALQDIRVTDIDALYADLLRTVAAAAVAACRWPP